MVRTVCAGKDNGWLFSYKSESPLCFLVWLLSYRRIQVWLMYHSHDIGILWLDQGVVPPSSDNFHFGLPTRTICKNRHLVDGGQVYKHVIQPSKPAIMWMNKLLSDLIRYVLHSTQLWRFVWTAVYLKNFSTYSI